jgi:hypothetical protein
LISGTADHTVPDVVTRSTFEQYRDSTAITELQQFKGRGHSLTVDSGWKDVADAVDLAVTRARRSPADSPNLTKSPTSPSYSPATARATSPAPTSSSTAA